ncbi:MAG: zinc metalloprotease HtpX [Ignavibacteriales bacterium]|nr:zinc metalloprotease HtpX [Ignavibacteriales bacterium]
MGTVKTVGLMVLMMALLMLVGQWLGQEQGLVLAFGISLLMNFGMYWFSDKLVLMSYSAKEATEEEAPRLYAIVRKLSTQAELPMPKVYIIPGESPNAFATGRNPEHAAVAATEGILALLSEDELEGVISHELAHVKHRDILTGTIVAAMAGAIIFLTRMAMFASIFGGGSRDRENSNPIGEILLLILAPIAAMLIQFAVSRSREFAADEGGAKICGKPLSLANALRKLERGVERVPMQNAGTATAHMFIVNPLLGGGIMKLFSTHPPTEERIARLEELATSGIH